MGAIFADFFKFFLLYENFYILIKICQKFVRKDLGNSSPPSAAYMCG